MCLALQGTFLLTFAICCDILEKKIVVRSAVMSEIGGLCDNKLEEYYSKFSR